MKKLLLLTLASVLCTFASFAFVAPIEGPAGVCLGSTTALTDSVTGGTWTSSNTVVATVGLSSGIVSGVATGTAYITYTAGGSYATLLFTVSSAPAGITSASGLFNECVGSTQNFADATPGGTWSSTYSFIASVGSTGVVTGVSTGTSIVYYSTGPGCAASAIDTVEATATSPISGLSTVCLSSTTTLTDAIGGGTWSSSNTLNATVSSSGVVSGVSAGTAIISYGVSGVCGVVYVTKTMTVIGAVTAGTISGPSAVCAGSTISLSDAAPGGTWTSSSTTIARVSGSGVVTGVSSGTAYISYTVTSSCGSAYTTASVVVSGSATPDSVYGPSTVCTGSTITLSDLTPGGVWTSSNTVVATISGGVVSGLSAGTTIITYTTTNACGTGYRTKLVTVISTTVPGSISGATSVMVSLTTPLTDVGGLTGGTWTSSNTSIATVDPITGVVTGVALGACTITYTVVGCSGSAYTTAPMTVVALNMISGNVNFPGVAYYGQVKVWLITYNPGTFTLTAVDSTIVNSSGTTAYYQFLTAGTDSFRMKAAVMDSAFGGMTGYTPTYHISHFYWHDADVLWHTAGTVDAGQDINMQYGVVTPGPGFISGNVMAGANKQTVTYIPSVGLKMYCIDAATGTMVQQTTTDASGNYTMSNLVVGKSYYIHPEDGGYFTTDYPSFTITTSSPTASSISFLQHTLSHTITPVGAEVVNNRFTTASVAAYPNPTSGKLNIQWQEPTAEKASVTITDITGRDVFKSSIDMNQGSGVNQLDLSGLTTGLYMINIKSAAINYNSKIQVQK
jgi:uncharacterized protein YjdB